MLTSLIVFASVIFLDIVLSGDNAVIIGMAANTLPKEQRIRAIIYGMILAAAIRIILSLFAVTLLHHRWISIIGGLSLLWVAYKLGKDILNPVPDAS
jgi:predicted tellurium resistance membrane protein TerC